MQNIYCHNCGAQLQSTFKFCNKCGTSLSSLTSKPAPPPERPSSFTPFVAGQNEDPDDDETYLDKIDRLPQINISKLEFEINVPRRNKETVASINAQGPTNYENRGTGPYSNVSKEDFAKIFSQEAGNSRNKSE